MKNAITTPQALAETTGLTSDRIRQILAEISPDVKFRPDRPFTTTEAAALRERLAPRLNGSAASLQGIATEAETKLAEASAKLAEAETKCNDLAAKLREAVAKSAHFATKSNEAAAKCADLETKLGEAATKLGEAIAKYNEAVTRRDEALAKLREAERGHREMERRVTTAERERDEMRTIHATNAERVAMAQHAHQRAATAESELRQAKADISNLQGENAKLSERLRRETTKAGTTENDAINVISVLLFALSATYLFRWFGAVVALMSALFFRRTVRNMKATNNAELRRFGFRVVLCIEAVAGCVEFLAAYRITMSMEWLPIAFQVVAFGLAAFVVVISLSALKNTMYETDY